MSTVSEPSLIQKVFKELKNPTRIIILLLSLVFLKLSFILGKTTSIILSSKLDFVSEIVGWILLIFSFKSISWRVEKSEYRFLIPLIIHSAMVIFIYTSARVVKDSMSNTRMSNEVTMILKCLVFAASILYQYLYNKLSKYFKLSSLIIIGVIPVVSYLSFFCFFLNGNENVVMSAATEQRLIDTYPIFARIIPIIARWPTSLYYIFAEVFAVCGLQVFMWQINNSQIKKGSAKRILPAIILAMQFPTLFAAKTEHYLSGFTSNVEASKLGAVFMIIATVILAINNFVFFRVKLNIGGHLGTLGEDAQAKPQKKDDAAPVGIWSHIKENSTFILLAMLTVFYGLSSSWLEQFWKKNITLSCNHQALETIQHAQEAIRGGNIKMMDQIINTFNLSTVVDKFSAVSDYFGFTSKAPQIVNADLLKKLSEKIYRNFFATYIMKQARYSLIFLIFGTSIITHYFSWTVLGSLTPAFCFLGTLLVLGLPIASKIPSLSKYVDRFLGTSQPISYSIMYIGSFVIACFKSLKYGSFDPSKEQFVLLYPQEKRVEIKHIEGYFGRIGKSFGSFFLAIIFGTKTNIEFTSMPVMILLFVLVAFVVAPLWIISVRKLGQVVKKHHLQDQIEQKH